MRSIEEGEGHVCKARGRELCRRGCGFLVRHATKLGAVTKELLRAEHNSKHYSLTTD